MDPLVVFTHVPKTAGTSFVQELIEPNLAPGTTVACSAKQLPRLALDARVRCAYGHFMYGVHLGCLRPVRYITFLREPVDRAISYYHFVQDVPLEQQHIYKHPLHDRALALPIDRFYESAVFRNMQTQYLAGYAWSQLYRRLPTRANGRRMLDAAVRHLETRYEWFGIQSSYEESVSTCLRHFGWSQRLRVEPQKRTANRPALAAVPTVVIDRLRELHELDEALYRHASRLFRQRTGGVG